MCHTPLMTRLQRFRAYMARMNPVADPAQAIKDGLYVPPPAPTVAEQLAMSLELEPASTHLVLGGIGSGKTTELLQTQKRLRDSLSEEGDQVVYLDVSRRHDLGSSELAGVLVALAGLDLANRARRLASPEAVEVVKEAHNRLTRHAHGYTQWVDNPYENDMPPDEDESDLYPVRVSGALVPPERPIPEKLADLIPHLRTLRAVFPGDDAHAVFLFDSLDRLPSPKLFREAVQHDLRVLKAAGVGVAVIGPIRFIAGNDRAITDLFDHTHYQLATDPDRPEGIDFLQAVLRRRAEAEVLPDECLSPMARASGGVLRDLISLAKSAGNEAYAAGHDPIGLEDVGRAIDAFGRDLAIGLDDDQVKKLKHLRRGGGFVIRGERELSLLETRRVLFYGGSRWAVHPALAPLLDAVPEAV